MGGISELLAPLKGLKETEYIVLYKDGGTYPKMRADAFHLPRYLARGFTLEPTKMPLVETQPQAARLAVKAKGRGKNICGYCGKKCKNLKNHVILAHSNNGG